MKPILTSGMKKAQIALLLVLSLAVSCSSVATYPRTVLPAEVQVDDRSDVIVLTPTRAPMRPRGLVYYPGGLVKPEAYILALAPLAAAGYPVVIVKMPFDLAFFGVDKGVGARAAVPGVEHWVIGGHSLGGVASAMAVQKYPALFDAIIFWASYPAAENDLSKASLAALSITATNDGLSTPAKVQAASGYLPPRTTRVVLEGGNHAQFGTYGPQKGDGTATLTREAQQAQAAQAVLDFLNQL